MVDTVSFFLNACNCAELALSFSAIVHYLHYLHSKKYTCAKTVYIFCELLSYIILQCWISPITQIYFQIHTLITNTGMPINVRPYSHIGLMGPIWEYGQANKTSASFQKDFCTTWVLPPCRNFCKHPFIYGNVEHICMKIRYLRYLCMHCSIIFYNTF